MGELEQLRETGGRTEINWSGRGGSAARRQMRKSGPASSAVKAGMTGNICRCGNYNHYVESVLAAAGTLEAENVKGRPA